jgi:hypothetical protein
MAKTSFSDGTIVTAEFLNAVNSPVFDDQELDGHFGYIENEDLSNVPGQLKPDWYNFRNALQVTHQTGLTFSYSAGTVLLNTGVVAAIAAGTVIVPDSATSFIYVQTTGIVAVASEFPLQGMPLARVTTAVGTIAGAVEDLRPRLNYPISFFQNFLTQPLTLYVSPDGSTSNSGLSASDPTTLDGASALLQTIRANNNPITIKLADGTYSRDSASPSPVFQVTGPIQGRASDAFGDYDLTVEGNLSSPQNVIIQGAGSQAGIYLSEVVALIRGVTLTGPASGSSFLNKKKSKGAGVMADLGTYVAFDNCRFGPKWRSDIYCAQAAQVYLDTNLTILSGQHTNFISAAIGGIIYLVGGEFTLQGTPAFTIFAYAFQGGIISGTGVTFSGSATGKRFQADTFGQILTTGGGANYFPGNSAGTPASGFDSASAGLCFT